jgi:RPA family protein
MADIVAPETAKRQVAFKVRISDVMENQYRKEEGWLPNYIDVGHLKVSRVNIIGVIVSKQADDASTESFVLDDGSGRVPLRFFKPDDLIGVGDVVLVIGRPREFGSERYIVPEIMKRVRDSGWVEVRKRELTLAVHRSAQARAASPVASERPSPPGAGRSEDILIETEDFSESPKSLIINTIRKLDSGSGVPFEDISVKSNVDGVDDWIGRLLESGDIFEVKPGRYKVLE